MESERPITARTGQLLRDYALQPKKSLGQNFLTDPHVLDKMIAAAALDRQTGVLEVGPGVGALTERLSAAAGAVLAVEIDRRLVPVLQENFADTANVHIVQGDILALDVAHLIHTRLVGMQKYVVVANLPYYITSAVIMHVLAAGVPFERLVFMTQKEVAERMAAQPGGKDYSMLSVAVQYYASVKTVARVPAHVFIPRPKVDSAVVCLEPHQTAPVAVQSEETFFSVVQSGFRERRKTLANNIKTHLLPDWSKAQVNEWLTGLDIDPQRRAETLSQAEFARISNALDDMS